MATIPTHLANDKYWKSVIYLFKNNAKLNTLFTTKYFDLKNGVIEVGALKRAASKWSQSEKFMLNLALHLYTNDGKVDLSSMDSLDAYNTKLVIEALKLRFM